MPVPALRRRSAEPVGHQVRVCWWLYPASWSTRHSVKVETCGRPSGAERTRAARSRGTRSPCRPPLRGRRPRRLPQDAVAIRRVVGGRPAAAVPRFEGIQALLVEAGDQMRNRVAALAADRSGGVLMIESLADQQEGGGAGERAAGAVKDRRSRWSSRRSASWRGRSRLLRRRVMAAPGCDGSSRCIPADGYGHLQGK